MMIDILTTDGSPLHICPACLYGDEYRYGCGGAEYYLLTLCEAWGNQGHKVRLYNSPHKNYKTVDWLEQFPIEAFNPQDNRDCLINFRTPNPKSIGARGMKTWWTTDQFSKNNYKAFAPHMDKIVCISQTHVDFFEKIYGIKNAIYIDIPVREKDFIDSEKIPHKLIFTSIPDRGLAQLRNIYPLILQEVPDVSLVITSDYRLWGAPANNEQYRIDWVKFLSSVQFRGAMPRLKYVEELCKADILLYPSVYQELFCIAVSEAQWAGTYPITTSAGALTTTNMGTILDLHPDTPEGKKLFVDTTVELLNNREKLQTLQEEVRSKARERFSLHKIMKEWDEKVFK